MSKKKIFVSCGEMSGDLHLSYIIEEMKKQNENVEFYGVVGSKSINVGAIEVSNIKNNDVMGFTEAIKKYKYFKQKAVEYLKFIEDNNIDTVIFVDFGGFNLKFFELIKKNNENIKTIYYIPPKVWAWGKKRINRLKLFDDVIVIFPFEKDYFDSQKDKTGLDAKYFGNPLVDKYEFSEEPGEKILLLAGSRRQEIIKFIPPVMELIQSDEMKNEKFLMRLADESHLKYIYELEKELGFKLENIKNLEISFESIKKLRRQCKYSIATSGTVTFEMALMGLPVIVVYRTSVINAFIARKIVKIKYISLTNINAGREIFPELLQEDFTAEKLLEKCKILNKNKEKVTLELKKEREKFGGSGVLKKIGEYLLKKIGNKDN